MSTAQRRPRRLAHFLSDHDITRTDLAGALGQSIANVSRKLRGEVPLTVDELTVVREYAASRIGRPVPWDEILPAANDVVGRGHKRGRAA